MTKSQTHKSIEQSDQQEDDQSGVLPDEASVLQGPNKTKKALSKREIMEQLSRDRFPWDEWGYYLVGLYLPNTNFGEKLGKNCKKS